MESLRSKPGKAQCVGRLYQMDISSGVIPHSTGPRPGMIEIKYCDFSFSLFFYFYLFFFFFGNADQVLSLQATGGMAGRQRLNSHTTSRI